MAQDGNVSLRATQRAPRSCLPCSSRKVRCDKSVPCSACIRRGEAAACTREIVIVRGAVTMYEEKSHILSYDELKSDNQRLRREIAALRFPRPQLAQVTVPTGNLLAPDNDMDALETKLWARLTCAASAARSPVLNWDDVILPSRVCSEALVAYDKTWNSWVHYAIQYPKFEDECGRFMEGLERGNSLDDGNSLWLAVYFAILSVSFVTGERVVGQNADC